MVNVRAWHRAGAHKCPLAPTPAGREASTKAELGAWHSPLRGSPKPGTNRALYPLGGGAVGKQERGDRHCIWAELQEVNLVVVGATRNLKLRSSDVLGPGGLLGPCCRIPGGR